VDTGTGAFNIYAPVIVNPADSSAVINGYLGLPPGDNRVFIVGDGAADCDLIVNAVIFGSPGTCFVKQGAGTMCLAGANTFNAPTLLEEGILDINSGFGLGTWPGLVIFDGATLRISGGANVVGGFEAVGAGVGGIHGAVEVLPGNSFSMSGGILLDAATTINVGSGGALGLGGNIVGAGPLIKTGGGALVMQGSANNTYSGDTMVSAGSLLLAKSANKICVPGNLIIGPGPAGPVTFARLIYSGELGGTTVTVNGNSLFDLNGNNAILTQLTLNDGGSVWTGAGTLSLADGSSVNVGSQSAFGAHVASTISGYLSLPIGSATFNVSPHASTPPLLFGPELDVVATIVGGSSGLLTVVNKYGLGQIQLDGNNTYFNQTRVYEGTLLANNGLALGSSAAGTYVYNGASLALINGVSVAGEYLLLDSTNGAALDSRSSADVWGGPIYLNRNSSLNVNNSLTASGVIDGPGSLIKAGLGSLTLAGSGNNTYTGDTFVNQGTLLLDKPTAVTAIPGPVEVGAVDGSSAGVVRNLTSYQIVGNIFVHSQGLYDVNGQQENVDYLGLDGNAVVQTGAGYLSLKTGGAINVTPGINTTATINHHLYLDAGNHVITVGSGATLPGVHDLVINAVIGDNSSGGSIQKEGPGRMRFTADNTYLGSTLVNAGTLQLDGAQPQSSIGVQGGGRLQGNGTVANLNYTGAAGTIAPGASPGIFTCNGFNPGAFGSGTLEIELNGLTPGSEYDQVHSSGSVWLNGVTLDAHINFASAVSNEFTIIAKDGTGPVNGTFTGLPQGKKLYIGQELFQISYTGGTGNDVVLTRLVTPPPPVLRIERGDINAVRLLWATNNPAFSLQTTTNLTSTNWVAATPLPVVIGTNDVVTNAVSRLEQFYRLSNP
jgi:fibronectin-binding autotransporter adhesin